MNQESSVIDLTSNQNKQDWCQYGEVMEYVFIGLHGRRLSLMINPAKNMDSEGKYKPDLFNYDECVVADLKTCQTPFFKAGSLYGMNPQTTVTFDRKDAIRYFKKYPHIIIYFWVMYQAEERYGVAIEAMEGIWKIKFSALQELLDKEKEHEHQQSKRHKRERKNRFFIKP